MSSQLEEHAYQQDIEIILNYLIEQNKIRTHNQENSAVANYKNNTSIRKCKIII